MYAKQLRQLLQITETHYMPQQAPENTFNIKPFEGDQVCLGMIMSGI